MKNTRGKINSTVCRKKPDFKEPVFINATENLKLDVRYILGCMIGSRQRTATKHKSVFFLADLNEHLSDN